MDANTIVFTNQTIEIPILELKPNGDILINGRLVENDKEVVDGLRQFLSIGQVFKSTGAALITKERNEQIEKHSFTVESDLGYNDSELLKGALFAINPFIFVWPFQRKDIGENIADKNYVDRLQVAGAFIAAEIDRALLEIKIHEEFLKTKV